MEISKIFKTNKKPLGIKMHGYTYLNFHDDFNTIYLVRKYDENNFDFATMKYHVEKGLFGTNKCVFEAGSNIKTLDAFMLKYLKHRDEILEGKNVSDLKINVFNELTNDSNQLEKLDKMYGTEIPEEIASIPVINDYITNDYKVLYVRDNASVIKGPGNTVDVVFYKEVTVNKQTTYILFKHIEFIRKKKDQVQPFFVFENPEIQIPTFLLK